MANVIADLALETEAVAWLSFRFVVTLDREASSDLGRYRQRYLPGRPPLDAARAKSRTRPSR